MNKEARIAHLVVTSALYMPRANAILKPANDRRNATTAT